MNGPSTTIAALTERRADLEASLLYACKQLERDFGVTVTDIRLYRINIATYESSATQTVLVAVNVEVQL